MEKNKKIDKSKELKKGKIMLFFGLLPYIVLVLFFLNAIFNGYDICFIQCTELKYGLEGLSDAFYTIIFFFIAVPYIMIPITIISIVLIVKGIKRIKKYSKEELKKKTSKN
ncbi:MAG: hypothetical protein II625_07755 [Bacilli bacterium]|nr:hypothetical protein [Bacilli bacterium]